MTGLGQANVYADQERLVGERVKELTEGGFGVKALGDETVDGIADAGHDE